MNPYDEQKLRDEVIYLHSLWHQGPPTNPNPPSRPINTIHNLPRRSNTNTNTNTRPFKKQKTFSNTNNKRIEKPNNARNSDQPHDSGPEWPVNPTPCPPPTTGWPELKPQTKKPGPVSAEDEAKMLAMRVQHNGLESFREYLSGKTENDEEEGEEDNVSKNESVVESDEYKFLLEIFVKDDNLRVYYEKNYEGGDFCCLVCGGIGEKVNKRYKDCLGLVQHAISISKTKRKGAHRAFGQVVCRVLGWDIDRLPVIVLKGEPLGKSLMNSGLTQAEVAIGNAEKNEDVTVVEKNEGSMTGNNGEMVQNMILNHNQNASELIIYESSLKVDVNQCVENIDSGSLNAKGDNDIAVHCEMKVDDASKSVELDGKVSNIEADTELALVCRVDDVNKCVENLDGDFLNLGADKEVAVDCPGSGPSLVTSTGWSCINPVDESFVIASGLSTWKTQPLSVKGSAMDEEQEKLFALQLQQKVSEACQEFFEKSIDYLMDEDGSEDSEEFKFFLKVFVENNELRSYYEKNYGSGEFCCLVCCGIGKKAWKKFKDCLGLLQHSIAISKTKKKRAHMAFGQVVCKVLGWDINRLPTIVLKGETLGHSLAKLGMSMAEVKTSVDGNKDNLSAPKSSADFESAWKEDLALMISEKSSNGDDTKQEDSGNVEE